MTRLHYPYRLVRQPHRLGGPQLRELSFEGLFDKLRDRELAPLPEQQVAAAQGEEKQRALLVVSRTWLSHATLRVGEAVLARFQDGHDW